METRKAAEAAMEKRDRTKAKSDVPLAFQEGIDSDLESPIGSQRLESLIDRFEDEDAAFNIENFTCPLKDWISQPQTQKEVMRLFKDFLQKYVEENQSVYFKRIQQMCSNNLQSLEVNYRHLTSKETSILALWLADIPKIILELFNRVKKID